MSSDVMYVQYKQDTGEITGISPRPSANHHDIEVNLDEVTAILEGKERKRNYRVEYEPKKKKLALVNQHEKQFDGASVQDYIYEVPEFKQQDSDISIIQDSTNRCWKILLGESLQKNLKRQGLRLNKQLSFSITAKHDPNILYKTLFVDFSQIVRDNYAVIPFSMEFEDKNADISIFTAKMFDSYSFQRDT